MVRQIRPFASPSTIQLQSQGGLNATPTGIQSAQTSATISPMPFITNSGIRVRLPNTPTVPTMIQQQSASIIPQHLRGPNPAATSVPGPPTVVRSTSTPLSGPVQVQTTQQQPTMVTIQGHQVILNPQGGITSTQVVSTGPGTRMATNSSGTGLTTIRSSPQVGVSNNAIIQQHTIAPQQRMVQLRPQQTGSGTNIVLGASPNVFRVPTPTGGTTSPAATVIVDASGVSGQTAQLPQAVMVCFGKNTNLKIFCAH